MNLLMTQQHLQQESAGPGSPAVPLRFQSGLPLASEGGSWHQRDVDFPSLKAPQTAHIRFGTHVKTVLFKLLCFFCTRYSSALTRELSLSHRYRKITVQAQTQVHRSTTDETVHLKNHSRSRKFLKKKKRKNNFKAP